MLAPQEQDIDVRTFARGHIFTLLRGSTSNNLALDMLFKSQEPQSAKVLDVLDDNGLRTKEVLPREEIHRLGKLHRAVHLYLLDLQGNILLQQRSAQVDHCPGMLSISLTAHVQTGESSSTALNREIEEELQLDPSRMRCHFLFS